MDIDISQLRTDELEDLLAEVSEELIKRDHEIASLAGYSLVSGWARDTALVGSGWLEVSDW